MWSLTHRRGRQDGRRPSGRSSRLAGRGDTVPTSSGRLVAGTPGPTGIPGVGGGAASSATGGAILGGANLLAGVSGGSVTSGQQLGATVGSAFGPIGTGVGAAVGQLSDLLTVGEQPGSTSGNVGKLLIDVFLTGGLMQTLGLGENFAGSGKTRERAAQAKALIAGVPLFQQTVDALTQIGGGPGQGGEAFAAKLRALNPAFAAQLAEAVQVASDKLPPGVVIPFTTRLLGTQATSDRLGIFRTLHALDPSRFPAVGPGATFDALLQAVRNRPGATPTSSPTPAATASSPGQLPATSGVPPVANVPTSFASVGGFGQRGFLDGLGGLLGTAIQNAPSIINALGLGGGGGGAVTLPGGFTAPSFVDLPMVDITPQGTAGITSPWRATPAGASAQVHVQVNPVTGRATWFKPAGKPVLFSGDLRTCRTVEKLARRAARATRRRGGR